MGIMSMVRAAANAPATVGRKVRGASSPVNRAVGRVDEVLPALGPIGGVGSAALGLGVMVGIVSLVMSVKGRVM